MEHYYTILTDKGAAKMADALRAGRQIDITHMALGDGKGALPTPQSNATALVKECYRAPINSASKDRHNPAWVIFELVLAPNVGGWWIREVGLYDKEGDLIAVGNYPEQYKPLLEEGASTTQTVSVVIQVLSSEAVTLTVDPSVVLATRQYVDEHVQNVADQWAQKEYELQKLIADDSQAWHQSLEAIHDSLTPRSIKVLSSDNWNAIKMPGVYGVFPSDTNKRGDGAPPATYWYGMLYVERSQGVITQHYLQHEGMRTFQRMTYEGSPEWGQPWAELGVANAGTILYTASQTAPVGYLAADGSAVSRVDYAYLFKAIGTVYGSGDGSATFNLPDLRGEFIRGLDSGRGVDQNRPLGSWQAPTALRTAMGPMHPDDFSKAIGLWYSNEERRNISHDDAIIANPRTPSGDKAKTWQESDRSVDNFLEAANVNSGADALNSWITIRPRNMAFLACIKY